MGDASPVVQPRTRKAVSPYDLFPGDTPGASITTVILRGDNYEQWSRAIRGSLRARRKYRFVDGTIKEPDRDAPEREDLVQVSSLAASWIFNSIEEKLQNTVTYKENARALWIDLEQHFNLTNGPKVHRIKKEIANCKKNGDSIMVYYGRINKLWDELANFKQTPTCACEGCQCGITAKLDKEKEEERLHQFLMGLDDGVYKSVRSNILGLDPLPNVNQAYQRVIQEEQLIDITREEENRGDVVGFAAKAPQLVSGQGVKTPALNLFSADGKFALLSEVQCTFCKRNGHEEANCFYKHGFPDWWQDRSRGRGRGRMAGRSRGSSARVNAATVGECPSSAPPPGVTPDQCKAILMALQTTSKYSPETLSGPKYQDSDWSG